LEISGYYVLFLLKILSINEKTLSDKFSFAQKVKK